MQEIFPVTTPMLPPEPLRTTLLLVALTLVGPAAAPPAAAPDPCRGLPTLEARIDDRSLAEDGTAELELQVVGSEARLRVRLINYTPGVVSLEGGDDQWIVSSGGRPNRLHRTLFTHRAGSFLLDYRLPETPCSSAPEK